jgi:hypothetical protein
MRASGRESENCVAPVDNEKLWPRTKNLLLPNLEIITRKGTFYYFSLSLLDICMLNFMPVAKRQAIHLVMKESGLEAKALPPPNLEIRVENGYLDIGGTVAKIRTSANPELIPDVLFYDILFHL